MTKTTTLMYTPNKTVVSQVLLHAKENIYLKTKAGPVRSSFDVFKIKVESRLK